jgi:hypothetical protein
MVPCLAECQAVVMQMIAANFGSAADTSGSGWTLAHVENDAARDKILAALGSGSGSGVWIGLRRAGSGSDDFGWTDGAPHTYDAWAPGNPSQMGGQFPCVIATGSGWVTVSCTETHPFFIDHPGT